MKSKFKLTDYNSMLKTFKRIDYVSHIYIFNYSSLYLYKSIKKELNKRNTNFRIKDFDTLFFYNIKILKDFINTYYNINRSYEKIKYKLLKVNSNFSIDGYNKLSDVDKFNAIFDRLILLSPRVNKDRYTKFINHKRSNYKFNIHCVKTINYLDIKEFTDQKKFNVKTKFYIKRKKNQLVNIYVLDLSLEEFKFIFKALSHIFNNCEYRIHIINNLYDFNVLCNNNHINVFLVYQSKGLESPGWLNKNRYILSVLNYYFDLFAFLNDNPNILELSKSTKSLRISERKSIYNKTYFISNRIKRFIDLLREEVNEDI